MYYFKNVFKTHGGKQIRYRIWSAHQRSDLFSVKNNELLCRKDNKYLGRLASGVGHWACGRRLVRCSTLQTQSSCRAHRVTPCYHCVGYKSQFCVGQRQAEKCSVGNFQLRRFWSLLEMFKKQLSEGPCLLCCWLPRRCVPVSFKTRSSWWSAWTDSVPLLRMNTNTFYSDSSFESLKYYIIVHIF